MLEAYLNIGTVGHSFLYDDITVIGAHLTNSTSHTFVHLAGEDVIKDKLLTVLEGVNIVCAYNGSRSDLHFIRDFLGVNSEGLLHHCDLVSDCPEEQLVRWSQDSRAPIRYHEEVSRN